MQCYILHASLMSMLFSLGFVLDISQTHPEILSYQLRGRALTQSGRHVKLTITVTKPCYIFPVEFQSRSRPLAGASLLFFIWSVVLCTFDCCVLDAEQIDLLLDSA